MARLASYMNITNISLNHSSYFVPVKYSLSTYYTLVMSAAIYLALLAVGTILGNGLLLFTIYKYRLHGFRKPFSILIGALAIADLLNGLIIDPLFSYLYFSIYFKTIHREEYRILTEAAMVIVATSMNASYLFVLLLSITQLIAVMAPYKHKALVTSRSVSIATTTVVVYSVLFALSYPMGLPTKTFQIIEVTLHMTGFMTVLIAAYTCLQISYVRQNSQLRRHFAEYKRQSFRIREKAYLSNRKFIGVNILLIVCLLVSSLPVTAIWYFFLFSTRKLTTSQMYTWRNVSLVVDNFLFFKFFLDPFIYAWRLPKFRRALKQTLSNACPRLCSTVKKTSISSRKTAITSI